MTSSTPAQDWIAAIRLCRRESRAGFSGFRIFAFALFLGVAAIAAIGSLGEAFQRGLDEEKTTLLGGDVEVSAIDGELPPTAQAFLRSKGRLSHVVGAQMMARAQGHEARAVVQLKGVDRAYPLLGSVSVSGGAGDFAAALEGGPSVFGAVADQALLDKLGISVGGLVVIGAAQFRIRAVLDEEPDRAGSGFMLGPRFLTSVEAAKATGLLDASALVDHAYRVKLAAGGSAEEFSAGFKKTFADKTWRVRTAADAARGLQRLLENMKVFVTMIGLSALIIGGIGASNAVRAYLRRKTRVIATLKCLGATSGLIFRTYMLQILLIALASVLFGVAVGAMSPLLASAALGSLVPFDAALGVYPLALFKAAAFGVLAAQAFAYWPLAEATRSPAARLFRKTSTEETGRAPKRTYFIAGGLASSFAGLAVLVSEDKIFAAEIVAGGVVVYGALRLLAWAALGLARRRWRPKTPVLRIAAANLTRPGSGAPNVLVSLGLGLTLLAVVSLIESNLPRDISRSLPQRAPALFFTDIAFEDADRFDARLFAAAKGAPFERYFMLRAGVLELNGKKLSEVEGAERSPWAREQDWGVTILKELPAKFGAIVDGRLWPKDYSGPPLIALSEWQAKLFNLGAGDAMTLSVSGRPVTATIAAIFKQNWDDGGLNFVAVFAPGALEGARPTSIGSLSISDPSAEKEIARLVALEFPAVTVIRTREVVQSVGKIVLKVAFVIRALTGVTIFAGIVVLLGAIASDFAYKLRGAMIMRTLGASRGRLLAAQAAEFAVLGAAPALAAIVFGELGAWFIVAKRMKIDWTLSPLAVIALVVGTLVVTTVIGVAAGALLLNRRPWPVLRSD